ncbi:DoxX family membrane protein [Candidatus Kaiserbacteria bacterium]|nr:DoxX family membrane protein [Candidatus Kaiserbacteria bacterium]
MIYTSKPYAVTRFLTADTASAPLWLLVRLYLGYEWLIAGWEKVMNPVWVGPGAGAAVSGFVKGALAKTGGAHPDVSWWYAEFLRGVVLPNATIWSNIVAVGELLVGVGLLVGLFTGLAAFFGFFMNMNYLLAGTVSTNPVLLVLALAVMLAHRVAGYWGLDYYVRPFFSREARSSKR